MTPGDGVDLTRTNSILPAANNTYDIGSNALRYKDLFVGSVHAYFIQLPRNESMGIGLSTSINDVSWWFEPSGTGMYDFTPHVDDVVSIGASSRRVKELHAKSATVNTLSVVGEAALSNVHVSGSLLMGPSPSVASSNNRIMNLAYGLNDLDACPKKQIDELDAITLSNARAYTDQAVSGLTPGGDVDLTRNILPSSTDTYDLGSAARRFRDCHVQRVESLEITACNITCSNLTLMKNLVMGPSSDLYQNNNRIVNLAYGADDLDACPMGQIQQMDNAILESAMGYADNKVLGNLSPCNVSPSQDDAYNLGYPWLRFKNCYAKDVSTDSVRVANSICCIKNTGLDITSIPDAANPDPNQRLEVASWRFAPNSNVLDIVPNRDNEVQIGTGQKRVKIVHTASIEVTSKATVPAPVADTDAATKGYVDRAIAQIGTPDNSLITASNVQCSNLTVSGGQARFSCPVTFDSGVVISSEPTEDSHAANKYYVDQALSTRLSDDTLNGLMAATAYLQATTTFQVHLQPNGSTQAYAKVRAILDDGIMNGNWKHIFVRDIKFKIVVTEVDWSSSGLSFNTLNNTDHGMTEFIQSPGTFVSETTFAAHSARSNIQITISPTLYVNIKAVNSPHSLLPDRDSYRANPDGRYATVACSQVRASPQMNWTSLRP